MLCLAAGLMFSTAAGLYNVISYGLGYRLPLAAAVLLGFQVSGPVLGLLPLVILVFPGGAIAVAPMALGVARLPGRGAG
jgi:hypothetical protein